MTLVVISYRFLKDNPLFSKYDVGGYSYGDPTVYDWGNGGKLRIGKYCSIASATIILLGGEHHKEFVSTYPFHKFNKLSVPDPAVGSKGNVVIGNDVWIGQRSTILSGVSVGNGAVVGAGSVVASDVPDYAVVVGSPAKTIKYRFTQEEIKVLLKIRWWDWPHETILERAKDILSSDVQQFIRKYE